MGGREEEAFALCCLEDDVDDASRTVGTEARIGAGGALDTGDLGGGEGAEEGRTLLALQHQLLAIDVEGRPTDRRQRDLALAADGDAGGVLQDVQRAAQVAEVGLRHVELYLALRDGGERTGPARRDDDLLQSLLLGLQLDVAQPLGALEAQAAPSLLIAEVADAEDEVPLARREGEVPQAVGQRRGHQYAVGRSNK